MPLSKRASLQAQRMMREAFMELERVITVSDRAQLKNLSLEDVQQAALQVEKQLAASQSLRNMRRLAPLFTGLEHYSQAIEVLCNGTPYLPWLWAPIKLVLKISADYIEAFEQIIKVYSRLAEPLARFSLFDRSFSNNIEVQNTLAVYYSDILKFHGEAYKFVRRNAWQRLFATSWGRFQRRFDNIFDDLKAHEDLVDKTVNAANLSEAKEMREKLEDWRQQEMAKLKKEEEERTSTEFRAVLSVLKVDETHQIKVFDNLISEANRNPGSCSWILQQPKIRSWARCERDTQFVVLHGFVGSGKSVLAAQIATFLRASEHSLVVAHFCTYLYPESTDYNYIMRSLMIQIIRLDPELITLSYDWLVLKKKAPTNTVVEQLLRLLVEAMGASPEKQKTLHIIIDGLDECDDNIVASVVKTLDKLIASASSSAATLLKVLLCTQMKPEVIKFVRKKHQVSLSSEKDHLNKAIQDYTLQRINAIRPSLSQLHITDDDVTALASQITQKADGMFLWAKLAMEYINKNLFYHRDEILKAAISLPRELSEFYGRMLSQIMANFDERSAQRISAVLSWIAFAKRPLRLAELLSALAFDTEQEQVDELVPAYILDRCEPLIQKQADSSYSFVHVSVRDFLQSSDTALLVTENESQRRHGLATVRCLLSGQQIFAPLYPDSERTLRVLRGLHGFHMYATEFWVDYLLASLESDQTQFFESNFFALSCRLAENFMGAKTDCEAVDGSLSDPRLVLLRQKYYPLYKMVTMVLFEQNKETIEANSIHDDTIQHDGVASDVFALKKRYQTTIRKLLNFSTYPGISFQQLEQFKQNFRTSAFTCQLWSCPYAALGFSNIDSLTRHEADHSKHICRVQGCQYPVFTSARLLKNHVAECHTSRDQQLKRNSIRKRPTLTSPSGPDDVAHKITASEEEPRIVQPTPLLPADIAQDLQLQQMIDDQQAYKQLSPRAVNRIREHTLRPLLEKPTLKTFETIVLDVPRRIRYKGIICLRDLEKILISMAPERAESAALYLDFCLTSVRCIQATVKFLTDREQIRPSDRPYTNKYFIDLKKQIYQYSKQLATIKEKGSLADDISLYGGIAENGRPAELPQQSQLQRQMVAASQNNRQHEGRRRPLNNNNQPIGDEDSSIVLAGQGNGTVPKLGRTMTDGDGDGIRLSIDDFLGSHRDIQLDKPNFTISSSPQPSPGLAVSSDAFNQRISAANNQHLNTIRDSPSSSIPRDTSPFRQSSPPAHLPPHDMASQPRMPDQFRFPPPHFYKGDLDITPQHQQQTTQQQQQRIGYPLAPTGPSTSQDNSLPLPIPPRLKVGGPRPPTPTPTLPLTAAGFQSTLPDSTSANGTPNPSHQALYISPSHRGLPVSFVDTASSPPSLPPLGPNSPVKRACDICNRRKINCDGTGPCSNCFLYQLSCTYNGIPQNKSPLETSQSPFIPPEQVGAPSADWEQWEQGSDEEWEQWEQGFDEALAIPQLEPIDDDINLEDVIAAPLSQTPPNELLKGPQLKQKGPRRRPRKHPLTPIISVNKITRGRFKTGCITCRKRKKKCDEAKPRCKNCEKNAVVCEGYHEKQVWKSGRERAEEGSAPPRNLSALNELVERVESGPHLI